MELDFKKKVIIGICVFVILGMSIYLYYDYASSKQDMNEDDVFENNKIDFFSEESNKSEENKDNINNGEVIIVHITGAVKNQRNC